MHTSLRGGSRVAHLRYRILFCEPPRYSVQLRADGRGLMFNMSTHLGISIIYVESCPLGIQALLRSEELCQEYFKIIVHVVVPRPFYFSSISLVITIHLSHPQESFLPKYSSKEDDYVNYLPIGISIFLKVSFEASFK